MNLLFPMSISASTAVLVLLIRRCLAAPGGAVPTGSILVASLLALAVLEHWFMVLPLPSERLWSWGFHDGRAEPKGRGETRQPA
jgi:putative photosynthetic complex assembly protein 2